MLRMMMVHHSITVDQSQKFLNVKPLESKCVTGM